MCKHLAMTFVNGRSVCLKCRASWNDQRGLPHGTYAVNGRAMSASQLMVSCACPVCLADIIPRVVDGELQVLCAGENAHDIAAMGRVITKGRRDAIIRKQEQDYYTVIDGLPAELRKEIYNGNHRVNR